MKRSEFINRLVATNDLHWMAFSSGVYYGHLFGASIVLYLNEIAVSRIDVPFCVSITAAEYERLVPSFSDKLELDYADKVIWNASDYHTSSSQ